MITVDLYEGKTAGLALDPARPQSLEDEIREHELIAQRDAAARLNLLEVVKTCDHNLLRLRIGRTIAFPLMSTHEWDIWKRFLPTVYSSSVHPPTTNPFFPRALQDYAFDTPPLSVLELFQGCQDRSLFDEYQIWTPEQPRPEPILVGFKSKVGPFLLAQWGESLKPFQEIEKEVNTVNVGTRTFPLSALAQQQAAMNPWLIR